MVFSVLSTVIFRYVLKKPCFWGDELGRYSMIWAGLLGISVSIRKGAVVGLEFFVQKIPFKIRKVIILFSLVLCALFLLLATYQGILFSSMFSSQLSPALRIPMVYAYSAVPIGCAIAVVEIVDKITSLNK